jgi:hypothetical protein
LLAVNRIGMAHYETAISEGGITHTPDQIRRAILWKAVIAPEDEIMRSLTIISS